MKHSEKIEAYIIPFVQQLKTVDTDLPGLNDYCKAYLFHLLQHGRYYTEIYAQVLSVLLTHSEKNKESIILVDYGAGNGLLGIFAKFCGFKKVYINDISENFTKAAAQVAAKIGIAPDGFITGDIDKLADYFKEKEKPDAIAGTDVIEHIYSLDHFFASIKNMNSAMVTVLTTGANNSNWLKARGIRKQQIIDEYEGDSPDKNILYAEAPMESFFKVRSAVIRSAGSDLSEEEIFELTKATRGLIKADIIKVVHQFIIDKKLPTALLHSTNTCDPVTGSWAERLLTTEEYNAIYTKAGFDFFYYNGFYNSYENTLKSKLLLLANLIVKASDKYFAPYIILTGKSIKTK